MSTLPLRAITYPTSCWISCISSRTVHAAARTSSYCIITDSISESSIRNPRSLTWPSARPRNSKLPSESNLPRSPVKYIAHLHHLKAYMDQVQIEYESLGQDQHNLVPRQYLLYRSGLLCPVAHAEVSHQEHTLYNLEQDVRLLQVFPLRDRYMLQ